MREKYSATSAALDIFNAQHDSCEQKIAQSESKITALEKLIQQRDHSLKQQQTESEEKLYDYENEIIRLNSEIKVFKNKTCELEENFAKAETLHANISNQKAIELQRANTNIERLNNELKVSKKNLQSSQQELNELQVKHSLTEQHFRKLEQDHTALKGSLREQEDMVEAQVQEVVNE